MEENGHSRIDLLILDIEGAEYRVLESILEHNLDIRIICIEYDEAHQPLDSMFGKRLRQSLMSLLISGYQLAAVEPYYNYTLIMQ